ncbi:LytR C-terminal domain-containing protein [Corynebacterium terpenotabidum]|uniref:LytR/CpsA/Psr regulator C-terminal domain-containing protein n=1 Tax=Corynebacterium terpenotabidum Y-11 TaxID=1200352 RepID=S4XEJ0_9CORY|nr:LytR C-terminal domain-containing protein [Corynebacterium terpenotabidum]AGP30020.1 hypothetical protein A606_01825 [Corynebacterium terpenotabidum Y-11]
MTEQNRPRHSRDPEPDPYDNSTYDNSTYDDAYLAGPVADAAAGASAVDGEPTETSGPPLRGLAMILTAVAVVLIIWGAFSLFGADDDGSEDTAAPNTTSAPAVPATDAASPSVEDTPVTDADAGASDTAGDADATADVTVDRGIQVTVLNNSTETIAGAAAERLRAQNWTNVGTGNLQDRIDGISEESRVYYPEGDTAAQAAAEELANEIGLTAVPGNADFYARFGEAEIREGDRAEGVVVVLTGPLA